MRDVSLSSRADIVCLQETKVMAVNHFFVQFSGLNLISLFCCLLMALMGVLLLLGRVQQFRFLLLRWTDIQSQFSSLRLKATIGGLLVCMVQGFK